jgi:hypothetical protein
VAPFIDKYAADKDPAKRLDFISFHRYDFDKNKPARAQGDDALIGAQLKKHGLSDDLPVFVTEMGVFGGRRTVSQDVAHDQVIQAAAMSSIFYHYNQQPGIQAMHWVTQHVYNDRKTQILDNLHLTPYGASLKMAHLHKTRQIAAKSDALGDDGLGIYVVASADDTGLAIQVWNYQYSGTKEYTATVEIANLGEPFAGRQVIIRRYLIDSTHSTAKQGSLQMVDQKKVPHDGSLTGKIQLESNSLCLLELSPAAD